MTESELSDIETELKIALPKGYREVILSRAAELKASGCFDDPMSAFFLDPKVIVDVNKAERKKNSGTGCAFPNWWKTFVLIGTNGGGDFYCLKLDEKPGVWMIGSDCGDKPTRMASSLKPYLDDLLKEHAERIAADARRQAMVQAEQSEELKAIEAADNAGAKEWLDLRSPYPMFRHLDGLGRKISPRKLRLFGIACCKRIPDRDSDPDCKRAMELAEQLVQGTASASTVAKLREKMKRNSSGWDVAAIKNLLQDDEDYLRDAPIYAGDADLLRVWSAVDSALSGTGFEDLADLLREVLGNPFLPVAFEARWRTKVVVKLAHAIYDGEDFTKMPALAEALVESGCDNGRILNHCTKPGEHIRGCWVLDQILEKEPEPKEVEFTWDFNWEHPTIKPAKLKKRLREFGTDATGQSNDLGDSAALAFSDWLKKNGDEVWAEYVRIRCKMDRIAPGDDYPDLVERRFEIAAALRPGHAKFEGFYFSGYQFAGEEWWERETDDMESGLPSRVDAVVPGRGAGPATDLILRIGALVSQTPVRGIDFAKYYPGEIAAILTSPGARHLRSLRFLNWSEEENGQVIDAIANAPLAASLESLNLYQAASESNAASLANAPFRALRRLDFFWPGTDCPPIAAEKLFRASWFRNLEQLKIGFRQEENKVVMPVLADMERLHSLALVAPQMHQLLALGRDGGFPALRRLKFSEVDLTGEFCRALGKLERPKVIELWLGAYRVEDWGALLSSPMLDALRVLTVQCPSIGTEALEALARSGFASELRILRLNCGNSDCVGILRSLARTALTNPGAFPKLSTLTIKDPYAKKAKRDTAEFLRKLALPNLRHFALHDCDFDDDCADAMMTNPTFANLTRLDLHQGYSSTEILSPKVATKLIRSAHLKHLIELEWHNFAIGDAVKVLASAKVLPNLGRGTFWGTNAPIAFQEWFKAQRPGLYVGS